MKSYFRVMLGVKSSFAAESLREGFIGTDFGISEDLSANLPDSWREFNKKYIIKTNGDVVYFVRETKSDTDPRTKRDSERSKFMSGIAHFRAIHVDFNWTNSVDSLQG